MSLNTVIYDICDKCGKKTMELFLVETEPITHWCGDCLEKEDLTPEEALFLIE